MARGLTGLFLAFLDSMRPMSRAGLVSNAPTRTPNMQMFPSTDLTIFAELALILSRVDWHTRSSTSCRDFPRP